MAEDLFQSVGRNLTERLGAFGLSPLTDAEQARNRALLQSPEESGRNQRVLAELYYALTFAVPTKERIQHLATLAIEACSADRVVAAHPWLLPYYCALALPEVFHVSDRNGRSFWLVYQGKGLQRLSVENDRGRVQTVSVPQKIQPHFVNRTAQKTSYSPKNTGLGASGYPLSLNAARLLAERTRFAPSLQLASSQLALL